MTQTLKKTLLLILSALLSISALFFVAPTIAKAESYTQQSFIAEEGIEIPPDFIYHNYPEPKYYNMIFSVKNTEDYAHYLDIKQFTNELLNETGGKIVYKDNFLSYEFTLRRVNSTDTNAGEATTKIASMRIVFGLNADGNSCYAVSTYMHDLAYSRENLLIPKNYHTKKTSFDDVSDSVVEEARRGGFSIAEWSDTANRTGPELFQGGIPFKWRAPSYEQYYDISFNFRAHRHTKHGFLNWTHTEQDFISEPTTSKPASIKQKLKSIYEKGTLEQEVTNNHYHDALEIIEETKIQDVNISYLIPIEGTPLATRTKLTVERIAVLNNEISLADVRTATGLDFNIFENTVYKFQYNETTQEYEPYYLVDSMVSATTKEGKKLDFFYDLNTSYADVFEPALLSGLLSQDEYEYALSRVYSMYPEALGNVNKPLVYETNIYGRFGMISFPDRNMTLEGAFANIFGENGESFKLTNLHKKDGVLTKAQYEQLLNEYGYSNYALFFESLFNVATGQDVDRFEATHYLFIAEPGKNELKEEDKVTPGIQEGVSGIFEGVSNFFGNLGSGFGAFFGSKGGTATIVVLAIAGVGVYVAFRMGAFKGIFKGGSSSKKRKK